MKIALFATTEAAPALALLAHVRQRHPGAAIAAFVRDEHRDELAPALHGCDVRRDKPAGGRAAFVRALRRERFDLAVVAWHGGERFQPLRLVALVCGARAVVAVDEAMRERQVALLRPWTWAGHALRRLAQVRAVTLLRAAAACYRATIGAVVAAVWLWPLALRWRFGRAPDRRP
jgi:hypothetical protein